jgi:FixJ family two-component response regulator
VNVPTDHPFRAAPLRLVVADDDEACRLTSSLLLRGAGFEVVEAENAAEVLVAVASGSVSLVLADIHMPGNERLELVRDLHEKCPGLPVLLFTGFASTETAIQSLNCGVVAYLRKPVRADELLDAVQRAVGLYETRRVVSRSLEQLRGWTGDLERLEQQMKDPRYAAHTHAVGSYLDLSLRRIMASVGDLSEVIDVLARSPGGAAGMRTHELEVALREAIGVLERTKRDFKSKELAELRLRLERVAGDVTVPQVPTSAGHVTKSEVRIDAGRAASARA